MLTIVPIALKCHFQVLTRMLAKNTRMFQLEFIYVRPNILFLTLRYKTIAYLLDYTGIVDYCILCILYVYTVDRTFSHFKPNIIELCSVPEICEWRR